MAGSTLTGATSRSPHPSGAGCAPGSTTATERGRPPRTRTCLSTSAPRRVSSPPARPPRGGTAAFARALREDRILHEIHATGGDVRRNCDLFGLSVEGATRYLKTVEHPDLTLQGERDTQG